MDFVNALQNFQNFLNYFHKKGELPNNSGNFTA